MSTVIRPEADRAPRRGAVTFTESIEVECDEQSLPHRVIWQERRHLVVETPIRWFQRRSWWLEEPRAERGRPGLVAHEMWRLQVEPEAVSRTEVAEVRTIDVSRHLASGRWRVVRVH
ncbi:hypothetical protein [Nesterenkonia halotolerans]|uniref:Nucleotidyltransferase n=1 Tax=Nesterenkonia halotolerans TaxID=225325 RepID=A0ABR9J407_9MICC|nr:hypothetical protein [Nesterenkonia halotolerans]MBE1513699.1 hypothetical protein [Nesterenkonia halotolerans]